LPVSIVYEFHSSWIEIDKADLVEEQEIHLHVLVYEACMPSGPGAVPGFKKTSFWNTLEAVEETDDKLSPTVIREGNTGQEPSSTVKTDENNYLKAQAFLLNH